MASYGRAGSSPASSTKNPPKAGFFCLKMAYVYILYSQNIDSFYTGSCLDFDLRLIQHRHHTFKGFTSRSDDWKTFLLLENLSYTKARKIERHIKRMKSKKYIYNLKKYPELLQKLLDTY